MRCPKCNGLMIYERYQDIFEVNNGWRCVICGEFLDHVVLENRRDREEREKEAAV